MLLRWLASLRLDISIGPAFIGRWAGRQMLDCFLPGRARYVPPGMPRYPAIGGGQFPVLSEADRAFAREFLRQGQERLARDAQLAGLNEYLHRNPDVMRLWIDGWPGNPPGPVR